MSLPPVRSGRQPAQRETVAWLAPTPRCSQSNHALQRSKEFPETDTERRKDRRESFNRNATFATFEAAHIGAVNARLVRELLL